MVRLWWCWTHGEQLSDARRSARRSCKFLVVVERSLLNRNKAAQVFTAAVIVVVRIADALIDIGSAFSMLSSAMCSRLSNPPAIKPFPRAAPYIVGVGNASANVHGYVNVPVKLAYTTVHHPLLVVKPLAFPLLVRTDVLRPHGALLSLEKFVSFRLRVPVCDVCREQRTYQPVDSHSQPHSHSSCAVSAFVGANFVTNKQPAPASSHERAQAVGRPL